MLGRWSDTKKKKKEKKWIKCASDQQRALSLLTAISHKQNASHKVISDTAEVHVTCYGNWKEEGDFSAGFLQEYSIV